MVLIAVLAWRLWNINSHFTSRAFGHSVISSFLGWSKSMGYFPESNPTSKSVRLCNKNRLSVQLSNKSRKRRFSMSVTKKPPQVKCQSQFQTLLVMRLRINLPAHQVLAPTMCTYVHVSISGVSIAGVSSVAVCLFHWCRGRNQKQKYSRSSNSRISTVPRKKGCSWCKTASRQGTWMH